MKHFTLKTKHVLCLMLSLLSIKMMAQTEITVGEAKVPVVYTDEVKVEEKPGATYSGKTAQFSKDSLIVALGIDSLYKAAQYVVNATDFTAVEDGADGWRNGAGDLCTWSDVTAESRGYCVKISDPDAGLINYLGAHHNGVFNEGETFTAYWGFVANDKAALVKVVINFHDSDPQPTVELPEAELAIANLQIVGEASYSHERYYSQGYDTDGHELKVADMAEKLGMEKMDLQIYFDRMVYVDQYSEGSNTDTLALLTSTDGWMCTYIDKETDERTTTLVGKSYASNCEVFLQQMAYSAANDTVSFVMGQYPGNLANGDTRSAKLYVVFGAKAYVINYNVSFVAPPYNGLEDMTMVGSDTITLSQLPTNDYSAVSFTLELDSIASKLGAENASDIQMQGLTAEGGLSNESTANNGGWWLDANGAVHTYSGGAFYIEPTADRSWTTFNVGQMPNLAKGGESYTAKLYLILNGKYYEVVVNFNIQEKEEEPENEDAELVGTRNITIEQTLDSSYAWSNGTKLPFSYLQEVLGTTDVKFVGETAASTEEAPEFTDSYTCTPYPGFWMTADGRVTSWGSSSNWGVSIAVEEAEDALIFNGIQFPGATAVGDSYTARFNLKNKENGNWVQVNLTYNIVESASAEIETVGEESITMVVSDEEYKLDCQLDSIAAKLGFESVDAMLDADCMRGCNADEEYVTAVKPSNGIIVNERGVVDAEGNYGIYFDGSKIAVYVNEQAPESLDVQFDVCLENGESRYVFHIRLMTENLYTAIDKVAMPKNGKLYDLQGRQVSKAQKGVYIQNGVKVLR